MKTIPPTCPEPETGRKYWRSLDQLAEKPEFRQWVEREFPAGASELTDPVTRRFQWETRYSAAGYIRLLETFSSHIAMEPWQRDRLYGEIRRRLALRPDGLVRRHWGAVLQVARKPEE